MTPPSLTAELDKLAEVGIAVPPGPVVLDSFGDSAELSRELVALIRAGRKRTGTSLFWAYAHEGEGDGSAAYWRAVHWDAFGRECARIGRLPTQDMLMVCCAFELVAVVPALVTDPTD